MIAITLDPERVDCVLETVSKMDGVKLSPDSDGGKGDMVFGHIHTKYVDADYEYVKEAKTLKFTNEVKHGLYDFVSDDTIGTHLKDIIEGIVCPETPNSTSSSASLIDQIQQPLVPNPETPTFTKVPVDASAQTVPGTN